MPDIGPLTPGAQHAVINAANSIALPHVPGNCDTLVLNLADTIESINGQFQSAAGQLDGVTVQVNGAVQNVLATYQGTSAQALATTWHLTQTDGDNAHGPLIAISGHLSGAPAALRAQVGAIQQGLAAMQEVGMTQRACLAHSVTPAMVQDWQAKIDGLTNALNNVGLILHGLAYGINSLNQGFKKTCATGFIPGGPIPIFRDNAFGHPKPDDHLTYASSSSGGPGVISRLGSVAKSVGSPIVSGTKWTAGKGLRILSAFWNGTRWVVTLKWANPRWDSVAGRWKFFAGDGWRLEQGGKLSGKIGNMVITSLTVGFINAIQSQVWKGQGVAQGTAGQFLAALSALGLGMFVDNPEAVVVAVGAKAGIGAISSAIHPSPQLPPFKPTTVNYRIGNETFNVHEIGNNQYTVTITQPGKPARTYHDVTLTQFENMVVDAAKASVGTK